MTPKNSIVLYKSKTLTDGTHPVLLQVYYQKKRKYFNVGVSGKPKEWDPSKSRFKKCRPKCKADKPCSKCVRNASIDDIQLRFDNAIAQFRRLDIPFNWVDLNVQLTGKNKHKIGSVLDVFDAKISEVEKAITEKTAGVGTRNSFSNTRNNLVLFLEAKGLSKNIGFNSIDYDFLKDFEKYLKSKNRLVYVWMRNTNTYAKRPARKGVTQTTVGIYMRNLRTIWNLASKKKLTKGLDYPFSDYTIKSGKPREYNYRYLNDDGIKKLIEFQGQIKDYSKYESLLYWLAMFYGNGMNMADLCRLEWGLHATDTGHGSKINYIRTKNRGKENQPPGIIEDKNFDNIINWFKEQPRAGNFVFPVLKHTLARNGSTMTEQQIESAYKTRNKQIIRHMRELCEQVGIEHPQQIDNYTARHSFAVSEYQKTKDIYLVSTKLLHTSIVTTEKYLKSLGQELRPAVSKTSEALPFTIMQKVS